MLTQLSDAEQVLMCEPTSHASPDDWKQALDTVVPCCLVLK